MVNGLHTFDDQKESVGSSADQYRDGASVEADVLKAIAALEKGQEVDPAVFEAMLRYIDPKTLNRVIKNRANAYGVTSALADRLIQLIGIAAIHETYLAEGSKLIEASVILASDSFTRLDGYGVEYHKAHGENRDVDQVLDEAREEVKSIRKQTVSSYQNLGSSLLME
jgi:hypothetical protein